MTETTDDLRARIVAAIRRAPFKELRTVDYPNGQLQITANVDDLAAAVLRAVAPAAVPSAPADRAAILREAVERLRQVPFTNVLTDLRRMANEAEYVATPCSFGACEPGGEPCTTHERLMAHAEGDHELCEPDCGTSPSRMADEAQQPSSTAPLAANLPLVQGRCPACNGASLFLGDGGYVTCSRIDCPEPDAASTALEQPAVGAQQPETQAADKPAVCPGFQWIGQSFATCERCGQPAWDHDGEEVAVEGAGPFDTRRTVRPWKPGQAAAIRAKWAPTAGAVARQADTAGEQQ